MVNEITLRGHHIESLAEVYAEDKGLYTSKKDEKPEFSPQLQKSIEEHRKRFGEEAYQRLLKKFEEDRETGFLAELAETRRALRKKEEVLGAIEREWLSNSDIIVNIVYGGDSLCEACPEESCIGQGSGMNNADYKQDRSALLGYGLNEKTPYTMGELIQVFDDHLKSTGFPSPRTKNGFGS